jgi:hypothetical protein
VRDSGNGANAFTGAAAGSIPATDVAVDGQAYSESNGEADAGASTLANR